MILTTPKFHLVQLVERKWQSSWCKSKSIWYPFQLFFLYNSTYSVPKFTTNPKILSYHAWLEFLVFFPKFILFSNLFNWVVPIVLNIDYYKRYISQYIILEGYRYDMKAWYWLISPTYHSISHYPLWKPSILYLILRTLVVPK